MRADVEERGSGGELSLAQETDGQRLFPRMTSRAPTPAPASGPERRANAGDEEERQVGDVE